MSSSLVPINFLLTAIYLPLYTFNLNNENEFFFFTKRDTKASLKQKSMYVPQWDLLCLRHF